MEAREPTPVPSLHRRHTRRPRLTRLLDASLAQAIIVTAPAGYGKTSLACEWLAARTDVAWYRATSASADLAAFSVGIADVAAPLVPGAGDRLRQRLRVAEAPEKAVRPLAELLAEDLAEWPEGAWLVIDDYHLVIDSSPVEEFMDWLLTLAPIRVLVTTRRRPAWASARRVLYGEVSEITKEQLAMTNDEAARVLDGRPSETVRALVVQAQGWPALIGLAALSATAEIPSERVSEGLFRYFAEEVFRREPAELQRFMLVASVPQTVNATIAREVLAVDEPDALLERLLDEGFLQESGPGEYAFHPLLRDFLRRKLESELPELVVSLADKAIAYARESGRWEEAFDLAIYRGHLDQAAEIIGDASPALLAAGRIETIEKWLSACGPDILRLPQAALARAEVLLRQGRFAEGGSLARGVAERSEPDEPSLSRAWCLAGDAAHFLSEDDQALKLHLKARDAAKRPSDRTRALWGAVVASAELELDEVDSYLTEFQALSPDDADTRLRAAVGLMLSSERRGSLAGVFRSVRPLLPLIEYATDPMVKSSFLVQLSYLETLRAHYESGLDLALRAEEICRTMRLVFGESTCLIARANAEIGLRHFKRAAQAITSVRKVAAQLDDLYLTAVAVSLRMKLGLAQGSSTANISVSPVIQLAPKNLRGEILSLAALSAAATGDYDQALTHAHVAQSLTLAVETRYLSRFAELIVHIRHPGISTEAKEEAVFLLADTTENEMFDALVTAYRAHPPLLELFTENVDQSPELRNVLLRANDMTIASQLGIALGVDEQAAIRGSVFTKREAEVLKLMCQGLSNREIAGRLIIANSTAKVHVHSILKKLGAKTRLQAVLLARETLEPE